jgi:hypothetical protein
MLNGNLEKELSEALATLPAIDGHLGAKGLHDILLYHMAVSDLYAAGCPSGARLTQYPGWPSDKEAEHRILEAIPYLEHVANTSTAWGIRMTLLDLYNWQEPILASNWRKLDAMIRERAEDRQWHLDVLRGLNIRRAGTEWARRETARDDDILQYALEWAFFTRCQWGEFDTALYELERCWGRTPETATPIGKGSRSPVERVVRSVEDVHEAVAHYVETLAALPILATATHLSTDLDLAPVSEEEMAAALKRRDTAGERERSVYASYINEVFLSTLEKKAPHVMFQFSLGAEPLPQETASRLNSRTIAQLGEIVERHQGLRFQCFLANRQANQSLCTLCRELPNLSLAGYWWHNFFPATLKQVMSERLDMLPMNKQTGFFSDAYCVEWVHGKMMIVRRCMTEVLAAKIRSGQYTLPQAIDTARRIMYETPQSLLGFIPSPTLE